MDNFYFIFKTFYFKNSATAKQTTPRAECEQSTKERQISKTIGPINPKLPKENSDFLFELV